MILIFSWSIWQWKRSSNRFVSHSFEKHLYIQAYVLMFCTKKTIKIEHPLKLNNWTFLFFIELLLLHAIESIVFSRTHNHVSCNYDCLFKLLQQHTHKLKYQTFNLFIFWYVLYWLVRISVTQNPKQLHFGKVSRSLFLVRSLMASNWNKIWIQFYQK